VRAHRPPSETELRRGELLYQQPNAEPARAERPRVSGGAMLKAAGLWQKTSAKGNDYFVGRLGGVKILILENRDRDTENEPSHHLFFVDGESARTAPNNTTPQRTPPRRRPAYPAQRRVGTDAPMPSDPVDDLWPGRAQ
jgi:hypothetical protein